MIEDGAADALVAARRTEAAARQKIARSRLGALVSPWSQPGAFHLWLDLPEAWRAEELAWHARERGVSLTSSEPFAIARDAPPHAVRICLGAPPDHATLDRGLAVVAELLATSPALARPTI